MENDRSDRPLTAEEIVAETMARASRDPLETLAEAVSRLETVALAHQAILGLLVTLNGLSGVRNDTSDALLRLLRQLSARIAESDDPTFIDDLIESVKGALSMAPRAR